MTPEEEIAIAKMNENDMEKCQKAYESVLDFFLGNKMKTTLWFEAKNPLLGNIPPKQMMINGKINKLIKFIESTLKSNYN